MEQAELKRILNNLIATWENEVIEFKEAGQDNDTRIRSGGMFPHFQTKQICAALTRRGWFLACATRTASIVGSDYRQDEANLLSLKQQERVTPSPD